METIDGVATALMGWDEKQKRWRAMHKGRRLQIRACDLVVGATTYDESVVAANRWFREQQAQIDRESAVGTHRPNELEHLEALESIQSDIKSLQVAMRSNPDTQPMLARNVELLKQGEMRLKQALRQKELPPIDDTLRNPLRVSPDGLKAEAAREAKQVIADRLRDKDRFTVSDKELENDEEMDFVPYDAVGLEDYFDGVSYNRSAYFHGMQRIEQHNEELKNNVREGRIQDEAGEFAGLQDGLVTRKREESGAIDEYERGMITQLLNEHGATVPESRKLEYHIDKFLESKKRECQLGSIVPGRLNKIISSIDRYRKWSPIINGNVDRIGTKEHIEAYYSFLVQQVLGEVIKPKYAHNLFGDFKMLVFWLVNEEVLKDNPRCLQLKSNKYTFPVKPQKPKVIPLPLVRRILDAVTDNPRLKLFVLLTLNCGFGASEIGKLTKDEYNSKEGRIRHKRCKTAKSANVPTVGYKLWNETRELLDQELANRKKYPKHPESADYLLVNSNGKPLWSENIETGKSDSITSAFKRLIAKLCKNDPAFAEIAYYQLRRTSSSQIANEPKYRIYNGLWLGHAPQSVADRHYNVVEDTLLDECVEWLHGRIFDAEPSLEG